MTWRKLSDDVAVTDYATSTYPLAQAVENEAALRADHSRSCGGAYGGTEPLTLRPTTTDGGLGPLIAPFIAPRPAFGCRLEVRLRAFSPDGPRTFTPWILADGVLERGVAVVVPDDAEATLVASIVVPGLDAAGSDWIIGGWGVTADEWDDVPVTEEGTVTIQTVDIDPRGVMSGTGLAVTLAAGTEYRLPSGQVVYIGGITGGGEAVVWPLPLQALPESVINLDTFGRRAPPISVQSWTVTYRSGLLVAPTPVTDGSPLAATGPALVRQRTVDGWAERSQWWAAQAEREPGFHGIPEHTTGDVVDVAMPHHYLLAAVRSAALVRTWGGRRATTYRLRVEELDTDGSVLSTEADETATVDSSGAGEGVACMVAQARRSGLLSTWTARDLLLQGEVQGYDLVRTAVAVGAPDTDDWRARLTVDLGAAAGHVASVSLVEVVDIGEDSGEVIVLGIATVWESADFASRPTVGLRVEDRLTTLDTGFIWEWDGSLWLLRQATVAAWANRPLPGTVPSGAGLDAGSRVTVATIGTRSDVEFVWSATDTMWDLSEAGALTLEQAFANNTTGTRFVSSEPWLGGMMEGTSTTSTALRTHGASRLVLSDQTAVYETVGGYQAHRSADNTANSRNAAINQTIGGNVAESSVLVVARRTRAGTGIATFVSGFFDGAPATGLRAVVYHGTPGASIASVSASLRRTIADGAGSVQSGIVPAQNEWFAAIARFRWAAGQADIWCNTLGSLVTGAIPGTPANAPATTLMELRAGGGGATEAGSSRRATAWKEGTFSDDDVALAFAIMRPIRDL